MRAHGDTKEGTPDWTRTSNLRAHPAIAARAATRMQQSDVSLGALSIELRGRKPKAGPQPGLLFPNITVKGEDSAGVNRSRHGFQ